MEGKLKEKRVEIERKETKGKCRTSKEGKMIERNKGEMQLQ